MTRGDLLERLSLFTRKTAVTCPDSGPESRPKTLHRGNAKQEQRLRKASNHGSVLVFTDFHSCYQLVDGGAADTKDLRGSSFVAAHSLKYPNDMLPL